MERFCYHSDDTIVDLGNEAGLKPADFGVSRTVIEEIESEMTDRERFLETVLAKRFQFMEGRETGRISLDNAAAHVDNG